MKVGELIQTLEGLDANSRVRLFIKSPLKAGSIVDIKPGSVYAANQILVRVDVT